MNVIAAKGLRCPMEAKPRQYITDDKAVHVPASAYYRRLVADGSLVIAPSGKTPGRGKAAAAKE